MTGRLWALAAAFAVSTLAGCSDKKSSPTSSDSVSSVSLTVSSATVIADGTKTVTVSFTNTGGGQATLTTTLGSFRSSASATVTTTSAAGDEVLLTCDGCTGTATVRITAAAGTDSKTVAFVTRSSACQASCAADVACNGLRCDLPNSGGSGVCASGTCTAGTACTPSPAGATTETSCSDHVDNNCDGDTDCAATSCDGQPCDTANPNSVCKNKQCTDLTSGLAVTVTPARTRLPAIAGVTTDVVVDVSYLDTVAPNLTLDASLSDSTLGTITPATAVTDKNGRAHFTFTTAAGVGAETITARITTLPSVRGAAVVTLPRLASLRLVTDTAGSVQYPVMGAKGSGWQDLGWLKVQAVDDLGLPYPDGLPVRFEHHQLGGNTAGSRSTLGAPLTGDVGSCLAAENCVGYQAVTASTGAAADTAGVASAWIYSGTVAGTLSATASAAAAGASFSVQLPTIAVIGAKASGSNFSLACSPRNVPALAETTGGVSLVDAPFSCEAALKDRFGNVLGRSTQVIFMAEAGAVGQPTWTPAYDVAKAGDAQMTLGLATQTVNTLLAGLPFDVDPDTTTAEPSWVEAVLDPQYGGTRTIVHNPRDGVVTVIAIADGEEGFWDANGNGTYDVGEPFVDLGEPFVDQNDNGKWDQGEWFLDLDGNGTWTGPNGRWDAHTKIWTQTIVVFTGTADPIVVGTNTMLGARIADPGSNACLPTTAAATFDVYADTTTHPGGTSQAYWLFASDQNLNQPATAATYAVDAPVGAPNVKLIYWGLAKYGDLPGLDYRYWPCDATGSCASQCRATAGNGACHMVPLVSGYSCGVGTAVTVNGATAGSARVRWTVDVPWNEYKNGYVSHGVDGVSGIVRP